MTEHDIRHQCAALRALAKDQDPIEQATATAAVALLEQALVDLHRIADAIERIAEAGMRTG